ncbi:hypothetical protein BH09PSE4_BH09PSE4_01510 [soil metagenome]
MKRFLAILWWTLGCAPASALAVIPPVRLCVTQYVAPMPDGRMLGHLPYDQAAAGDLVLAPAGFALGQPCLVRRPVAVDLARMLAAARADGVTGLKGVSCYRSVEHQRAVFCSQIGPGRKCANAAQRARTVGPPGYSEHATGYAIDFGVRPSPRCEDVDDCIADTRAGKWLIGHAAQYGFELSFPTGNAQGVTWEPWHWRWVGTVTFAPGASDARALFQRARAQFPASPAVAGEGIVAPASLPNPDPSGP